MQLRHGKTLAAAGEGPCKVMAIAWSPNNVKLAVVTVDRVRFHMHCQCPRLSLSTRAGRLQDKRREGAGGRKGDTRVGGTRVGERAGGQAESRLPLYMRWMDLMCCVDSHHGDPLCWLAWQ